MNWLVKEAIEVCYTPKNLNKDKRFTLCYSAINMLEQGRTIKRHHNEGTMTNNMLECLGWATWIVTTDQLTVHTVPLEVRTGTWCHRLTDLITIPPTFHTGTHKSTRSVDINTWRQCHLSHPSPVMETETVSAMLGTSSHEGSARKSPLFVHVL
jgi:hypothetical protein